MSNATPIVTYDADVKALYIQFSEADVLETIQLAHGVYLDVDREGQPVGFEILHADNAVLAALPTLPDRATLQDLLKATAA